MPVDNGAVKRRLLVAIDPADTVAAVTVLGASGLRTRLEVIGGSEAHRILPEIWLLIQHTFNNS